MELNVSFTHLLKDEPPGYRPATFGPDLRAAADLYSTGETDALLDTKANLVAVNAQFDAVNTELLAKAPIASPVFTGVPQAPTPATSAVDAQLATTAFVNNRINFIYTANDVLAKLLTVDGIGSGLDAERLGGQLYSTYAPLASPAFSGNPTAPTQTSADISLRIANTQHVSDKITLWSAVNFTPFEILTKLKTVDGTGSGLDTDFFRGMQPSDFVIPSDLTVYAPLASPAFTGTPTAPTPSAAENSTRIATTAFVQASYAKIASPTFTGTPAAPTATIGTNTTQIATTAFVQAAVGNVDDITHTWLAAQAFSSGISFGSVIAATPQTFSNHIALYGTSYGFTITAGTINYVAGSGSPNHVFWGGAAGTTELARIGPGGVLTLGTALAISEGGTGATTAAGVRTNIGLAAIATTASANDITSGTLNDARLPTTMSAKTFTGTISGTAVFMTGDIVTAGTSFYLNNNSNKHIWFRTAASVNRALLYNEVTDNSLRFNLYNTAGTFVRALQFRESDGRLLVDGPIDVTGAIVNGDITATRGNGTGVIFLGGGSRYLFYNGSQYEMPSANLKVGSAIYQTDGNIIFAGGMTPYGASLAAAFDNKISNGGEAGSARFLKNGGTSGGTNMQFNWSGLGGQPTWLWGGDAGSTGTQMYVYNPSNFNVSYANSSGNADTVDGYHAIDLAQIYKGTNDAETNLPIGTIILMSDSGMFARNGTRTPTLYTGNTTQYIQSGMGGAGSTLSGTWRLRGYATSNIGMMQRIA